MSVLPDRDSCGLLQPSPQKGDHPSCTIYATMSSGLEGAGAQRLSSSSAEN